MPQEPTGLDLVSQEWETRALFLSSKSVWIPLEVADGKFDESREPGSIACSETQILLVTRDGYVYETQSVEKPDSTNPANPPHSVRLRHRPSSHRCTLEAIRIPRRVPVLVDIVKVAAGSSSTESHCAAVSRFGQLYMWGGNSRGQLGMGPTPGPVLAPEPVDGFLHAAEQDYFVADVSCGADFTVALVTRGASASGTCGDPWSGRYRPPPRGRLYSFGANERGQLGCGLLGPGRTHSSAPQHVALPDGLQAFAVSCGGAHAVALAGEESDLSSDALPGPGCVLSWGSDRHGQLGLQAAVRIGRPRPLSPTHLSGHFEPLPRRVEAVPGVPVAAAAGERHTVVSTLEHGLFSWGDDGAGQLGVGEALQRELGSVRHHPERVHGDLRVAQLSCTARATFAVTNQGALYAWGHAPGLAPARAPRHVPRKLLGACFPLVIAASDNFFCCVVAPVRTPEQQAARELSVRERRQVRDRVESRALFPRGRDAVPLVKLTRRRSMAPPRSTNGTRASFRSLPLDRVGDTIECWETLSPASSRGQGGEPQGLPRLYSRGSQDGVAPSASRGSEDGTESIASQMAAPWRGGHETTSIASQMAAPWKGGDETTSIASQMAAPWKGGDETKSIASHMTTHTFKSLEVLKESPRAIPESAHSHSAAAQQAFRKHRILRELQQRFAIQQKQTQLRSMRCKRVQRTKLRQVEAKARDNFKRVMLELRVQYNVLNQYARRLQCFARQFVLCYSPNERRRFRARRKWIYQRRRSHSNHDGLNRSQIMRSQRSLCLDNHRSNKTTPQKPQRRGRNTQQHRPTSGLSSTSAVKDSVPPGSFSKSIGSSIAKGTKSTNNTHGLSCPNNQSANSTHGSTCANDQSTNRNNNQWCDRVKVTKKREKESKAVPVKAKQKKETMKEKKLGKDNETPDNRVELELRKSRHEERMKRIKQNAFKLSQRKLLDVQKKKSEEEFIYKKIEHDKAILKRALDLSLQRKPNETSVGKPPRLRESVSQWMEKKKLSEAAQKSKEREKRKQMILKVEAHIAQEREQEELRRKLLREKAAKAKRMAEKKSEAIRRRQVELAKLEVERWEHEKLLRRSMGRARIAQQKRFHQDTGEQHVT